LTRLSIVDVRRSNREASTRRTRQVAVGYMLCRAAYGSLFLDGLGRVQSTTLPKISVDEAANFIVHRDRMEAPAQDRADETVIITVVVIADKTRSRALGFSTSATPASKVRRAVAPLQKCRGYIGGGSLYASLGIGSVETATPANIFHFPDCFCHVSAATNFAFGTS
jgi:hypothetical protein